MSTPAQKTILVVDDEPDVRMFFETALDDAGFNVMTAANGQEALNLLLEKKPDLITLDLVMPGMTGAKFLYEMKKNSDWKSIPVLVVTAHAKDELGKDDLEDLMQNKIISGPGVYLEKPVTPVSYVAAVKRALGLPEEAAGDDPVKLKAELQEKLKRADPATIKKMLESL